jgi:hypothetical protein
LINAFNNYKKRGSSSRFGGGPAIYDYLLQRKFIKRDEEQIRKNCAKAVALHGNKFDAKHPTIYNDTKSLCVDDLFEQLVTYNKELNQLTPLTDE